MGRQFHIQFEKGSQTGSQGVTEAFLREESERRKKALEMADRKKCGLVIHVYENRTDYFLDLEEAHGEVSEIFLGGMNDDGY